MVRIKDWKAKRAGGRITITGVNADSTSGGPIRIVGVDVIEAAESASRSPIATDKNGERYELV